MRSLLSSLKPFALAFAVLGVASLQACAPIVGDACEASSDCGTKLYCEEGMPGGYCTLKECQYDECPDEGVCVRFSASESFCMKPCESNKDCRDGYRCVDDFGPYPFCNDARGETPEPN